MLVAALLDQVADRPEPGPPLEAMQRVWAGRYRLVISQRMLDRLGDVLARSGLRIPPEARSGFLAALTLVRAPRPPDLLPPPPGPLTPDPEDDQVLWTALAYGAHWLVTGNRRHFTALRPLGSKLVQDAGLQIVTPREFIEQEDPTEP